MTELTTPDSLGEIGLAIRSVMPNRSRAGKASIFGPNSESGVPSIPSPPSELNVHATTRLGRVPITRIWFCDDQTTPVTVKLVFTNRTDPRDPSTFTDA